MSSAASTTARSERGSIVVILLGVLSMAPTVGDAGGCGRTATALDRDGYARARKLEDCERCQECGLMSGRCERACDPAILPEIVLPVTCRPLDHDGEVCLRALSAASCGTFAAYVDDTAAATPPECSFCREASPASSGTAPSLGDSP